MWPFGSEGGVTPSRAPKQPEHEASKKNTEAPNPASAPNPDNPDKLPSHGTLPKNLQSIVDAADKDDSFFDELVEGYAPPSTDSNVRFAGYAARFRTILLSAQRYVAYTSDIGESFRPVAHPWLVRGAYGISWAYIAGDVGYEGYKAYWQNQRVLNPHIELSPHQQKLVGMSPLSEPSNAKPGTVTPLEDYRTVMIQRGLFQSLASMGLPAFTIHSVVRYSGRALKDAKNKTVRTWAPIGLGLAVVPFLPTLFDKPVENAVEWVFHRGFETFGGHEAVGEAPLIGRERQLSTKPKEKEL